MKVKSESEVAQSCPTLSDPMDCSPPGSSIHGIFRQEYWSGVPLPSPSAEANALYATECTEGLGTTCDGQNDGPKDVKFLVPGTCEYVTCGKRVLQIGFS